MRAIEERKKKEKVVILSHIQHGLPSERKRRREEQRLQNNQIQLENEMREKGKWPALQNPSINYAYARENYGGRGRSSHSNAVHKP